MSTYILAIDQGTTSTRALIINGQGKIISNAQKPHLSFFPQKAWVEHCPETLWQNVLDCCEYAMYQAQIKASQIKSMGITNQRETTILWNKKTKKVIYPAIVWQDRRTVLLCEKLKTEPLGQMVKEKTGLIIDPYFSVTKISWILEHVNDARKLLETESLLFGTVDSFLLWKLTDGAVHATDVTNASRTALFNIHELTWDKSLCDAFEIPETILPEVKASDSFFGYTDKKLFGAEIPIYAMAGDQQAAAIGHGCFSCGDIKSTYGTGCFMLLNTGKQPAKTDHTLLTTILYQTQNELAYAVEGSIFTAGSGVKWLRNNLNLIESSAETEALAASLQSNEGVYFIPALSGLGAPHWQPDRRGSIHGLTLDSTKAHIVRAMLEAVGYQTRDLFFQMQKVSGLELHELTVDGGMVKNKWLTQWLADILGINIYRKIFQEVTVYGIALLAGLGAGVFKDLNELKALSGESEQITTKLSASERESYYQNWLNLISIT